MIGDIATCLVAPVPRSDAIAACPVVVRASICRRNISREAVRFAPGPVERIVE